MRVKHIRKTTSLLFDGSISGKDKITKVFVDLQRMGIPFLLVDSHSNELKIIKIKTIKKDGITILEKCATNTLKRDINFEDILEIEIESTPGNERAICVADWRALEI